MSSHDSIPSIDGWLYFFGSDEFLSRINIDTKEIEHVAGKPTEMPWWAKIKVAHKHLTFSRQP